jgi:hypothetical protein
LKRRWKKALAVFGVVAGVLAVALAIAYVVLDEPRPVGREGADAEALAARMERAVNVAAWEQTGAVRWTFAGQNEHLWDRARGFTRVRWDENEALLHEGGASGRAYRAGRELHGEEAREVREAAYARWINDSFWLNPIAKLRDPGVSRAVVTLPNGTDALLVSYASGGLTPGDAYLWIPGESGLPRAWKMWVSVIPVGGVGNTWEGWITLSTGAKIATRHAGPLGLTLELTDVEGAASVADLVDGPDPFAPLLAADD